MLNRWIGIVCAVLMVGANTLLVLRDFVPRWLAGAPPELDDLTRGAMATGAGFQRQVQTGIYDAQGRLVGRSWAVTSTQDRFLNVSSTTMLFPIRLPNGLPTPPVRITTELRYREEDSLLNDLHLTVRGLPEALTVRGESITPTEFACEWQLGRHKQRPFVLDANITRAMGDVLRPFVRLPGLYVGRTWRLQLLDPLKHVLPGLPDRGILADAELVRVTRTEMMKHRGRELEVFVVETTRLRAWVAPQGDVLRQEVDLPLVGKLTFCDEFFDADALQQARSWSPAQFESGEESDEG